MVALCCVLHLMYDRNHYFGLGPISKPKPKLADTFGRYRNRYWVKTQKSANNWGQLAVKFWFNWSKHGAVSYSLSCINIILLEIPKLPFYSTQAYLETLQFRVISLFIFLIRTVLDRKIFQDEIFYFSSLWHSYRTNWAYH